MADHHLEQSYSIINLWSPGHDNVLIKEEQSLTMSNLHVMLVRTVSRSLSCGMFLVDPQLASLMADGTGPHSRLL